MHPEVICIPTRVYRGEFDTPKNGKARESAMSDGTWRNLRFLLLSLWLLNSLLRLLSRFLNLGLSLLLLSLLLLSLLLMSLNLGPLLILLFPLMS